ncbi:MAG: hypothetical protein ACOYOU_05890 [Kiritimatiellia bacterium]
MPTHSMFGKSHVGRTHADNQDEVLARQISRMETPRDIHLIGVADGISRSPFGGSVARWIMRKHLDCDAVFPTGLNNIGTQFATFVRGLHAQFLREFEGVPDMLASGASLSLACLWEDVAICGWAGDCPVFLSVPQERKLTTTQVSLPDIARVSHDLTDCFGANSPFNFKVKELAVPHGGILTIASDGAQSDAFTLNDLYQKNASNLACLQTVIDAARKYPTCDDVSIVACKREL